MKYSHIISVEDEILLTEICSEDKQAYIDLLSEKEIYDRTLAIPYPYTEEDADWWLNKKREQLVRQGRPTSFAIRDTNGKLMGGIGFDELEIGKSHRAEIGYWLGKPYWGKGIMTQCVAKLCKVAFDDLDVVKVTAHIFSTNKGSERVLRKCGFEQEGLLRKHYFKNGSYLDAKVFSLLKRKLDLAP